MSVQHVLAVICRTNPWMGAVSQLNCCDIFPIFLKINNISNLQRPVMVRKRFSPTPFALTFEHTICPAPNLSCPIKSTLVGKLK